MPFTKYSNLDFDQIKTSIKDYLRANSTFTDFDFEGSNFSVLIDTLAYNTYITAFNSNMIVNESFLDSATLRENVVSLARNIGYVPRSTTSAKAVISFEATAPVDGNGAPTTSTLTLKAGVVCVGRSSDSSYTFSIVDDITAPVDTTTAKAQFSNITVYEGSLLSKTFNYDGSLDQRFILNNAFIDTSTLSVFIKTTASELIKGVEYELSENIFDVDKDSRIYFLQEVQDERYELIFGDGLIGKKLGSDGDGTYINAKYIVTSGKDGNGATNFSFSGTLETENTQVINPGIITVTTNQPSQNGSDIESLDSIKYYAPKLYSSQYRAVTSRDYEAIIKRIYPDTESVSIVGGEELDPPQFGTVQVSIKPKNGSFVSDFNKSIILSELKKYSVSGINQKLVDLKILYVELNSAVYFNNSQTSSPDTLKTRVTNSLTQYSKSLDLNKFGGRIKYSKIQQVIDNTDTAITSNITKVIIRRDLKPELNKFAQYELCYGNQFHVNAKGYNIKSTGFKISGESDTVYFTDVPNEDMLTGTISVVKRVNDKERIIIKSAGTVDYVKGEILLNTLNITSTSLSSGVIEIQAFPESNDVVGLRDLYVSLSIGKSTINMVRDVIASGDEISGTRFVKDFYTSSYSNGSLIRE
tara:strand:+ start:205 stop:2127 length:1923 start_codon:yes stop_codon:yes gene_type:complete